MRVVITGATGNVGTSVLAALATEPTVNEIVALARRPAELPYPRTKFVAADIAADDLTGLFAGAHAVIHLAWLIQPGRDESVTRRANVVGTQRVFRAVAQAGVPALLYASSVGAYSRGPKDRYVDESWPTEGTPTSFYARHKAIAERELDHLERERPSLRVVRMRPGLIFKREAATEIRRLFAGPLLPGAILRPGLIPFVPEIPRFRFQAVHSLDVGDAFHRALVGDARGPFNLAAEPSIGPGELAGLFHARRLRLPAGPVRAVAAATFALRLQPSEPGWFDMGLAVPLMDCSRARSELGWRPRFSAVEALSELLAGMREAADLDTPPLARATSGPGRIRELLSRLGARP